MKFRNFDREMSWGRIAIYTCNRVHANVHTCMIYSWDIIKDEWLSQEE